MITAASAQLTTKNEKLDPSFAVGTVGRYRERGEPVACFLFSESLFFAVYLCL